ncbi:tetratricopeptide (TPR) repeat protein [Novosphingobium sp. SG751A]|uniref:hypothetical protein n=1 Tax=Novosphingobium sp. SG751A TaxID=2587000 RepID=UPI0015570C40|nr:hypothetical protein [Novosphingobium sp. SG751A]NOW48233.1 tetratricopeptide (TPR) repeat protein [Novosphingobium sp. SG751A]
MAILARCSMLALSFFGMWANVARAAPRRPADPNVVLERLPGGIAAQRKQLSQLRGRGDLDGALQLADAYLRLGRKEADPRFYAYAQFAIAPWSARSDPPPEIILRRATIRQFYHDFDGALTDLETLGRAGYDDPQVDLLTASILRIRGDYGQAMRYCQNLLAQPNQLPALTCAAEIQGLGGNAAPARAGLERAIGFETARRVGHLATPALLAWSRLVMAGLYERSDDAAKAGAWFRSALATMPDGPDAYALGAYADFLLDHRRDREVIALLDTRQSSDGLLLRLAIACAHLSGHGCPAEKGARLQASLAARFDAVRARGEVPHRGEEARFLLELKHKPGPAYRLALANWGGMKEPRDALVLAQSALALGTREAAQTALRQLDQPAINDIRLLRLRQSLEKTLHNHPT